MNKNQFVATGALAALLIAGGGLYQAMAQNEAPEMMKPVSAEESAAVKTKASHLIRQKTIGRTDYFYEDFEDEAGEELALPKGWTTTATPGNAVDKWQCGTLSDKGSAINGASGWQYAFVLGRPDNKAHDTWLFSPDIHLTEGTHYLDFYTYQPRSVEGVNSVVEVMLCSAQSAESVITNLATCNIPGELWTKCVRSFTAENEGDYVIGFHCCSPANTNAVLLDNVRVSDGGNPIYGGYDIIEIGDVDVRVGKGSAHTEIFNRGNYPLSVKLKECSPEITVTGLPLEVIAYDEEEEYASSQSFTATVNLTETGDYEGYILLSTNDILHPEVRITVTATGKEYSVCNYISESFEYGQPTDWDMSRLCFVLKAYGAQDGANSWYSTTDYYDEIYDGIGFTTNYVDLGSDPKISFWYKAYHEDWRGNAIEAAKTEEVIIRVLLNEDDGNWNEVYSIVPDTDIAHNPIMDFQKVEFSIPEHKGETRRMRLVISKAEGGSNYSALVDNIKVGTSPDGDIALTKFEGPSCITAGETANYTLTIVNQGSEPLDYAALQLIDQNSGNIIRRFECPEIAPFATYEYKFNWTFKEAGSYNLIVHATNWNDPNENNNDSYPIQLSVLPLNNSVLVINDGKDLFKTSVYPVNFNSVESKNQTVYYANELGINKGTINSIKYKSILTEPYLSDVFSIYVAETDKEDFADGGFIPEEEFTKVFEGNVYFRAGTNEFVIPFSTPYEYKGKNLVIMSKREAKMFMYGVSYQNLNDTDLRKRSIGIYVLEPGGVFGEGAKFTPSTHSSFPVLTVNMSEAAFGSVEGSVTTEDNVAIEGAKVTVSGTSLYTYTDKDGHYTLPKVAVGDIKVSVEAAGYYPAVSKAGNVAEGESTTISVSLKAYPLVTLSGKVTSDYNNTGIQNVCVAVDGYAKHRAYTDAGGNYKINGVAADTGIDYSISFEHPYFKTKNVSSAIYADVVQNMELAVKPSHPNKIHVSSDEETKCTVNWNEPLAEYSYDNGKPVEFIGWNGGHAGIIAGARFLKKTEIEEVSWYCSSTPSGHEHFNVIIFGLFPDGSVNPNNILYVAEDVDYTDDAWTTHRLTRKITADGYLVAISCDGYLSIGVCEPSEDTPFEKGQNYYAGMDFTYYISEMSSWKEAHFMIRAYGSDKGEWSGKGVDSTPLPSTFAGKPVPEYNVYRFAPGTPREEWAKIATVSQTSYTDPDFESVNNGEVRYAVTSVYGRKESIPTLTDIIDKITSGIITVSEDKVEVKLDGDMLVISDPSKITELRIFTTSGVCIGNYSNPEEVINLADSTDGILIVTFATTDGKQSSFKVMR